MLGFDGWGGGGGRGRGVDDDFEVWVIVKGDFKREVVCGEESIGI